MARGAARGLDQARRAAQETFLVRVQNRHQRHLRQVEPLAQQVDADQHVELALAQGAQDLHPLDGVNFAVEILDVDADLAQVIGEFLRGALGQRGHQHALLGIGALAAFVDEIVNLPRQRLDGDLRIDQPGGAHDQFDDAGRSLPRGEAASASAGSGEALRRSAAPTPVPWPRAWR